MNSIDTTFRALKEARKKAFIVYITAGDPDLATTARLIPELERAGADIIELGIPFSDPLADGSVIQAASHRALRRGVNLDKIFAMVGVVRAKTAVPLVFMTYFNPVLQYGLERFFKNCAEFGVDGIIVPDLPVEEADDVTTLGRIFGIATIFLAAPTSTERRLKDIIDDSTGFIYYVSLTGVTGARRALPPELGRRLAALRAMTDKPVAVGFGIADCAQAKKVARIADGVIVGSAIVRIVHTEKNPVPKAARFAAKLAKAIHGA